MHSPLYPVALTEFKVHNGKSDSPIVPYGPGSFEEAEEHIYGLPTGLRKEQNGKAAFGAAQPSPRSKPLPAKPPPSPAGLKSPHEARRQFSFSNFLHRNSRTPVDSDERPPTRPGIGSRGESQEQRRAMKTATEEERLGLVKGDSHHALLSKTTHSPDRSPERARPAMSHSHSQSSSTASIGDDQYPYQHQYPSHARASPTISDDGDEWQTPSPPIPSNAHTYHQAPTPTARPADAADDDRQYFDEPPTAISAENLSPAGVEPASSGVRAQGDRRGRGSGRADTSQSHASSVHPFPEFVDESADFRPRG
jgi:hypothetical protein